LDSHRRTRRQQLLVEVHFGGSASTPGKLTAQVLDVNGRDVSKPLVAEISAGQSLIKLQTKIASPKLWTAETPNLYRVRLTFSEQSKPLHTITRALRLSHVRGARG